MWGKRAMAEGEGTQAHRTLEGAWWARVVAALWMAGVVAAQYFVWVRALLASVPAQR
jgi:hypothetical protein